MRLLSKEEFTIVKSSKNKIRTKFFWGQAICSVDKDTAKLGIITTRKLGDAHLRNRARRLVRELFRRNASKIKKSASFIVLPRKEMLDVNYQTLELEFNAFLQILLILK